MNQVRRSLLNLAILYRRKHSEARNIRKAAPYNSTEYNRAASDESWYSGAYFATRRAWYEVVQASV